MTEDPGAAWAAGTAAERRLRHAREHRTMADLLLARDQVWAAATVAASLYSSYRVDEWEGGQYEVTIAVPAAVFDRVDAETRTALEEAARDVIGERHFRGLLVEIRLQDPEPGWQRALLERVTGSNQGSTFTPHLELPPGADDAKT